MGALIGFSVRNVKFIGKNLDVIRCRKSVFDERDDPTPDAGGDFPVHPLDIDQWRKHERMHRVNVEVEAIFSPLPRRDELDILAAKLGQVRLVICQNGKGSRRGADTRLWAAAG